MFTILPHTCFLVFIFLLHLYVNWNGWLNYNKILFHCNFHFLMWSLLLMLHPLIGPFIFRDLGYLYQLVVHGLVPCLELILPCRNFRLLPSCYVEWPSTSLVRWLPCIWITVLLRLTCVIKVVQCLPFLSRLACWILSLTNKHGITLLPAYIPTHLNVEADFLSRDQLLPEWHLLPQVVQAAFPLWGFQRWTSCIFLFYSMPPLFHFGNSTASGGLGVECLQPSLEFSGKLCVSSSSSGPSCSVQVSSRTCQQSTQTFASGGSMLDGSSLASHSSQHAGRCSSVVSHHKRSCCGCFGRPGTQGSAISAFNPLLLSNVCYANKGSLPQSVRQWQGQLKRLHQGSTSSAGGSGPVGVLDRVYQTVPSLPLN